LELCCGDTGHGGQGNARRERGSVVMMMGVGGDEAIDLIKDERKEERG
jgi:hypothetical protein